MLYVFLSLLCYSLYIILSFIFLFFFKQKTAYEMRISDWSSDVCSSDLAGACDAIAMHPAAIHPANDKVAPQTRLLIRIDRYLRAAGATNQIGRASCRERVCQYV